MKLTLKTEEGQTVTLDVMPGDNIWLHPDGAIDPIGSLFLSADGATLGLGAFSEDTQWWEFSATVPTQP